MQWMKLATALVNYGSASLPKRKMPSSQAAVFDVLRTFQTDGITGYRWRDRVSRRALSGWPIAVEFGFFPADLHASIRIQACAGEFPFP